MRLILALLLSTGLCAAHAEGQSSTALSNASSLSAEGSATVVNGALDVLAAAGSVVVRGVEVSAEGTVLVLETAAGSARTTLRLSGDAARSLSLAAGASVEVSVTATGYLLIASGQLIAFIPNEVGKALLHHSRAA
ncbi:MAG TPA: hypothetical protein VFF16_09915 [Telluria sp.]|nr:hypothetical protein [Telluria sp.]